MIITALSVAYGIIGIVLSRMLAGHLAWRMLTISKQTGSHKRELMYPTGEQWFGAWTTALAICIVWPLVLLAIKTPWCIGAEKEATLAKREARIKKLEKELGI